MRRQRQFNRRNREATSAFDEQLLAPGEMTNYLLSNHPLF